MAELQTRNHGSARYCIRTARSIVIVLLAVTTLIQTEVFSDDSSESEQKTTTSRELPNPFVFRDGRPVRTAGDWKERRKEIQEIIVNIEYGGLPPTPSGIEIERLHSSTAKTFSGANFTQYRIVNKDHPSFHFRLDVMTPAEKKGKLPVVLTGDACWKYATDEIVADILRRGYIFAQFSRTAIVPDVYNSDRDTGLYKCYPEHKFGAIAAWAWGYHRCVDALLTLGQVDPKAIAIVGHSRGGKTVLLAGATDERIAVTAPNDSGSGGAGSFVWQGPESENMGHGKEMIPYWYGPDLWQYIGKETEMPFDQHFLKALVAPRALVSTEALGDVWANPSGTLKTHLAAKEVFKFLGVEDQIGIWFREGEHYHGVNDWSSFLDFMEWRLFGKNPTGKFDANPFPELPTGFSWRAPTP